MLFYKSSQRSTVLDRPRPRPSDHDNMVEEQANEFLYDDDRDYVLDTIARAARAEADAVTSTQPSNTSKERLSSFENELLWAWSEK